MEEELKLDELKKLIKKSGLFGVAKDGLKITINSCGTEKDSSGKDFIKWEIIAEKDNKIIKIYRIGNRMYDIRKAWTEVAYSIGANNWHLNIK